MHDTVLAHATLILPDRMMKGHLVIRDGLIAEIGDDRARFTDARALKAYAGSAPVTRASGRSICITHRQIKNNRLANVGWMWAFCAASTKSE